MTIKTINSHCVVVFNEVNSGCGSESTIFSYNTPVLKIDSHNNLHRLWSGWSATTQRDINRATNNVLNINKKMWEAMPIED